MRKSVDLPSMPTRSHPPNTAKEKNNANNTFMVKIIAVISKIRKCINLYLCYYKPSDFATFDYSMNIFETSP